MTAIYRIAHSQSVSCLSRGVKAKAPLLERSLHLDRDGEAFLQILSALGGDYQYEETLYDFPARFFRNHEKAAEKPGLVEGALAVSTTRPTHEEQGHGGIDPTDTVMERAIHAAAEGFFQTLRPRQIAVREHKRLRDAMPHQVEEVSFAGTGVVVSGEIARHRGMANGRPSGDTENVFHGWSAGYLFFVPKCPGLDKRGLIVSFGMDGTCGLLWAHVVRRQLAQDVREMVHRGKPALLVGEFPIWLPAPAMPITLAFTDKYQVHHVMCDWD